MISKWLLEQEQPVVKLTIIVPVTRTATRMHRRGRRDGTSPYKSVLPRLLLDHRDLRFGADGALGGCPACRLLPGFIASAKFVESEGTGSEVGAFVETALVADNFAWVEGGATP